VTRLLLRWPGCQWLVTFVASALAGILTACAVSMAGGCGVTAQQRAVSAAAEAARAVDEAVADEYERVAGVELDHIDRGGGDMTAWCEAVAAAWDRASAIDCPAVLLASIARSGQAALDAAEDGTIDAAAWAAWSASAALALDAVLGAYEREGGEPPGVVVAARGLLSVLVGSVDALLDCRPTPPPGCEAP